MVSNFLDRIIARAQAEPERKFAVLHVAGAWHSFEYGTLLRRASVYAGLFASTGLDPGDVVFLVLRQGLDAYAAFLGTMLAGGVPSLLPYPNNKHDHELYWTQHRTLFARVRPRFVLVYDELMDAIAACAAGSGAGVLRQPPIDASEPFVQAVSRSATDLAVLQHSSGTTGLKKGVALSYGAIVKQIESYACALGIEEADGTVVGSWLPLYHDMGLVATMLLPLYLGAPIVALDPFIWTANPKLLLQAIEAQHVTHVWLPNFAFHHLVRAVPRQAYFDLASLRAVINCSEPCKPAAFDDFLQRYANCGLRPEMMQTCYAMAETVFAVAQSRLGSPPRRLSIERATLEHIGARVVTSANDTGALTLLSNGPTVAGCTAAVLVDGISVGEGMFGEICVRAEFLFDGYHKNLAANEQAYCNGWFRTGDLGFIVDDELYVAGRLKDLIIVNGKNIFAHDVEGCLLGIAGLKPGRVVALGIYDELIGSEQLVVVAERDGSIDDSTLISAINRATMSETGIPCSAIHLVPLGWLMKTTSGKVSRAENRGKYLRDCEHEDRDV